MRMTRVTPEKPEKPGTPEKPWSKRVSVARWRGLTTAAKPSAPRNHGNGMRPMRKRPNAQERVLLDRHAAERDAPGEATTIGTHCARGNRGAGLRRRGCQGGIEEARNLHARHVPQE